MIHPATELRFVNAEIGYGVFVTERIPRGTVTWTKCALDRVITPVDAAALGEPYRAAIERYAYVNGHGDYVLCWDHGRYMNHSCRPGVLSPGFDIDVAVRDIEAGEELTCDYALLNLDAPMPCRCGVAGCRGTLSPDDAPRMLDAWDKEVRAAFSDVARVAQPLAPFLRERTEIEAAARGERGVPSCGVHLRRPR